TPVAASRASSSGTGSGSRTSSAPVGHPTGAVVCPEGDRPPDYRVAPGSPADPRAARRERGRSASVTEGCTAVEPMLAEHAQIERELADPGVHADAGKAKRLGRRYAELTRVVTAYTAWRRAADDAEAAAELAEADESFAAELPALRKAADDAAEHLRAVLVPRDPDDGRDVILEIKAGEGGEESALFAGDLLRMYLRYAERRGWGTQVLGSNESDLGGYTDVAVAVKSRSIEDPADGVWASLKYEGGVHRVQRVPVTESQGRIHTSAAGVLVLPEADDPGEVEIDQNDLRIDVYRSSGPGGQSVNTTDS